MGRRWTAEDEIQAELASPASNIGPSSASSVWIDNSDLLFRDLLRAALAHLLAVIRHRILRGSAPTFSLGDHVVYSQFLRQHAEPKPEPGPNASEAERWLAEDLNVFEGIECYRA